MANRPATRAARECRGVASTRPPRDAHLVRVQAFGPVEVLGIGRREQRRVVNDPVPGDARPPRLLARQGRDAGDGLAGLREDDLLTRGGPIDQRRQLGLRLGDVHGVHRVAPGRVGPTELAWSRSLVKGAAARTRTATVARATLTRYARPKWRT